MSSITAGRSSGNGFGRVASRLLSMALRPLASPAGVRAMTNISSRLPTEYSWVPFSQSQR